MKLSAIALILALESATAFSPCVVKSPSLTTSSNIGPLYGYLDDLSSELYGEDGNPVPEEETREATQMKQEDVANFGVGNWNDYVEFDEFDGGDGQMGVAGDGNKKLEGFDMKEIAKSKSRSARVSTFLIAQLFVTVSSLFRGVPHRLSICLLCKTHPFTPCRKRIVVIIIKGCLG